MKKEFYNTYRGKLINGFRKRIKFELLEEFINDAFIVFEEKYDETRSKPITFLYKVLDNRIKLYYSRENKIKNSDVENFEFVDEYEGYDFEYDENKEKLRKEMYKLDELYKDVAIMFFIKNMSLKEISEKLELNINTIKSRIHTSKKLLKKKLK